MKKKILAALIAVLIICLPLSACGESFNDNPVEGIPDSSYAVISNGGSAVQFGKYVYFINGYRGYDDAEGKDNLWGSVVKGGLYRAELLEGKDVNFDYKTPFGTTVSLKTYEGGYDAETLYSFVTKKETIVTGYEKDDDGNIEYDDNDNPIEITEEFTFAKAELIAPKTIGTSGYSDGGIFIFDEFVYYASPSNHQNRDGTFDTGNIMFFRTRLDGTQTTKIYTTKSGAADSQYSFYKQGDKVYLVVKDGTSVISVAIGDKKVEQVKEIASEVTSVLFPAKKIYYKGMDTNTVDDFIYYTRALTNDDKFEVRSGNVVVAVRPDGSESSIIIANGNDITLRNTDGGYLFYEDNRVSGAVIAYTNLHEQYMQSSPTYKEAYQKNEAKIIEANGANSLILGHQSGIAVNIENIGSYTDIICFRPNTRSNQVFSLLQNSNSIELYDGVEIKTIYSGTVGEIYAVDDSYVYFGNGSGNYYRTNAYLSADQNTVITLGESMTTAATFKLDVVGGFAVMFGEVDEYASDYTYFVSLDKDWSEKQFVGVKSSEDVYDPSVELNPPAEEGTEGQN